MIVESDFLHELDVCKYCDEPPYRDCFGDERCDCDDPCPGCYSG